MKRHFAESPQYAKVHRRPSVRGPSPLIGVWRAMDDARALMELADHYLGLYGCGANRPNGIIRQPRDMEAVRKAAERVAWTTARNRIVRQDCSQGHCGALWRDERMEMFQIRISGYETWQKVWPNVEPAYTNHVEQYIRRQYKTREAAEVAMEHFKKARPCPNCKWEVVEVDKPRDGEKRVLSRTVDLGTSAVVNTAFGRAITI